MNSRMLILLLAALVLHAVSALPVKQDSLEESTATDEELLQLLAPQDFETEPNSMEFLRINREIDPDIHSGCHHHSNHAHPDELAHEHHGHIREERAVGEDSSNSSEEKAKQTKQGQQDNSSGSSEEQKANGADVTAKPARRRRAASQEVEKQPAESEADLDPVDPIDPINIEDYAQGCEVLEVDSSEAINNETTYVE